MVCKIIRSLILLIVCLTLVITPTYAKKKINWASKEKNVKQTKVAKSKHKSDKSKLSWMKNKFKKAKKSKQTT